MSFQKHVERHRQTLHLLQIQPFIRGQKPVGRYFQSLAMGFDLLKAKIAFRKFAKADRRLQAAEFGMRDRMTPAQSAKSRVCLKEARKRYDIAKRSIEATSGVATGK